jgi:hypothetical protein
MPVRAFGKRLRAVAAISANRKHGIWWLIGKKPLAPARAQTFTLRSACP